jgi:hypothetical protein
VIECSFEAPGKLLNMNDRQHWAAKARLVKAWRDAAYWAAVEQMGRTPALRRRPPSIVTLAIPVKGNRRRDPGNWFATVKPCVDGLVDAGVWEDDDMAHVALAQPVLVSGGALIEIHLAPLLRS